MRIAKTFLQEWNISTADRAVIEPSCKQFTSEHRASVGRPWFPGSAGVNRFLSAAKLVALAILMTTSITLALGSNQASAAPNIIVVNIDDMGWGDFASYGSQFSQTPRIDQLATQGTRFTQFYAGAPICSPSRAAMFTGQYAARSGINTFLNNTNANLAKDTVDSLSLNAPSMAQTLKDGGYATGHFGKWHLGGGRDVGYAVNPSPSTNVSAPRIVEYGYDEAWTQFEGLGNRIINVTDYGGDANGVSVRPSNYLNGLNNQSDQLGTGGGIDELVYLEREYNATFTMNRAIEFLDDSKLADPNQPVFMNIWLDEVHTPHDPSPALKAKYDALYPGLPAESRNYLAVLEHVDSEIGRLVDHIDNSGHGGETLILITADNGATDTNVNNIGSSGPFMGTKGDVFEGGVRSPLIARWTGNVAANRTDTDTVMWMPDLLPSLTAIAGVANPVGVTFDGENLSNALLGNQTQTRTNPLFWNSNRGTENRHGNDGDEVVALRSGDWKLIMKADGTSVELYNLSSDLAESTNVALQQPAVTEQLASEALGIRYSTPSRILPNNFVSPVVRLKAEDLASLGNGAAVASWTDTATGDSFNGSVTQANAGQQPTLLTNQLNGRAVVEFDGSDLLASSQANSLPVSSEGLTVFAVATSDTSGQTAERLGQLGDSGGTAGEIVGFDMSSSSTSTNNGGAGFRFNDGAALYDSPITTAGFHIVAWQVDEGQDYSEATLFVDGTDPNHTFTGSSNSVGSPSFSGSDLELLLGTGRGTNGNTQSSDSYSGQLAEFLVFNDQLTIGEMNLVGNYLSTEYGLPFIYQTSLNVLAVEGLAWVGGTANFDLHWNAGDGAGGLAASNSDPFDGLENLFLGNNGVATYDGSTDDSNGMEVGNLFIGTNQAGTIVNGSSGNGTLNVEGSENLTTNDSFGTSDQGYLIVGENGQTGTLNWNSTGTLDVQGRLRIGLNGGTGIVNQNNGTVQTGTTSGSLKYAAVGEGAGSVGTYNLNSGAMYPDGQGSGSPLRQVRVGHNGATGTLRVGDGVGSAGSALFESEDDLWIGANAGDGTLVIEADGEVRLNGNGAEFRIGSIEDAASATGLVIQNGGTLRTDGLFTIGQGVGGVGEYQLNGGSVFAADDGAGDVRVGGGGGNGTFRISGTASFSTQGNFFLAEDGGAGTTGLLELTGSQASFSINELENAPGTAGSGLGNNETISWIADPNGITSIVVTASSGSNFVQLQDPAEVSANTGTNGNGDLMGDGIALELDLSALTGSQTLMLIDNQSAEAVIGFFEDGTTMDLYEEGESISGTGFSGTVSISYLGGTGNDVVLNLVAGLAGDFDGSGRVDGLDFLVWQRNPAVGNLADWEANYGLTATLSHAATVPEPSSLVIALVCCLAFFSSGR